MVSSPGAAAPLSDLPMREEHQGRTGWDTAHGIAESIKKRTRWILLGAAVVTLVILFGTVAILYIAASLVIGFALFTWLLSPNGVVVDVVKPCGTWDTYIVGRDLWHEVKHDGPPQIKITSPTHTGLGRPRFVAEDFNLESKTVRFSWVSGLTLVDYHCDMGAYQKLLDFVHARMDSWLEVLAYPTVMGQAYAGDIIEGFLGDFGKRIKSLDPKYQQPIPFNERVNPQGKSSEEDPPQGVNQ